MYKLLIINHSVKNNILVILVKKYYQNGITKYIKRFVRNCNIYWQLEFLRRVRLKRNLIIIYTG